jgi:hypothetical protein
MRPALLTPASQRILSGASRSEWKRHSLAALLECLRTKLTSMMRSR